MEEILIKIVWTAIIIMFISMFTMFTMEDYELISGFSAILCLISFLTIVISAITLIWI